MKREPRWGLVALSAFGLAMMAVRRHGRGQAARSYQRRHDQIGRLTTRDFLEPVGAGYEAAVGEFLRQGLGVLGAGYGNDFRLVAPDLPPEQFEVATGREPHDPEPVREFVDHRQGRGPDGPRGSEDNKTFHGIRPIPTRYPRTNGAA